MPRVSQKLKTTQAGRGGGSKKGNQDIPQQILLHITLHPPQQKRPQNLMQRLDNFLTRLLFILRLRLILMQKTVQIRIIHKYLRAYEIQQREQLLQAILQRGTRDQQPSTGDEGADDLRKNGIHVLDTVRFVNDDIFEAEFLEGRFLDEADLVARYTYFEILWDELVGDDLCAYLFGLGEDDNVHVRSPLFELARPVLED